MIINGIKAGPVVALTLIKTVINLCWEFAQEVLIEENGMTDRENKPPRADSESEPAEARSVESNERAEQGSTSNTNTNTNTNSLGGAFATATEGRGDLWRRALFMVLFAVLYGVAEFVLWMVVVVQFLVVLFTGSANEQLLRLGSSLSIYSYQLFRYLTFTGDEQPFPMSAWPADEAEDSPWFDTDT